MSNPEPYDDKRVVVAAGICRLKGDSFQKFRAAGG
jgi:hypothetical protein